MADVKVKFFRPELAKLLKKAQIQTYTPNMDVALDDVEATLEKALAKVRKHRTTLNVFKGAKK